MLNNDLYYLDAKEYKEGQEACIKYDHNNKPSKNPYTKGTEQFYNWNRGWNSIEP